MSDLKTTEGVRAWIKDVTWLRGYHAREEGPSGQIERRAREAEYTETAAKIALAMRVLETVEALAKMNEPGFRNILAEAKKGGCE